MTEKLANGMEFLLACLSVCLSVWQKQSKELIPNPPGISGGEVRWCYLFVCNRKKADITNIWQKMWGEAGEVRKGQQTEKGEEMRMKGILSA